MSTTDSAHPAHFDQSDYYVLAADHHGTVRLALQNHIWATALSFTLHPSLPALPSNAQIADVACGTALWLIDAASQLGPDAQLHGFDTNLGQAPPAAWRPANVHVHRWDFFDDVPARFVGAFDLVHVRLVTVAVKTAERAARVASNLCKMLKPGGHLQWDEVDTPRSFVATASPELHVPRLREWCAWMAAPKRADAVEFGMAWRDVAAQTLADNGFDDVGVHDLTDAFCSHMHLLRYNSDQLLMLTEQYAQRAYAPDSAMRARLLALVRDASRESERGACLVMPPLVVTARKAVTMA